MTWPPCVFYLSDSSTLRSSNSSVAVQVLLPSTVLMKVSALLVCITLYQPIFLLLLVVGKEVGSGMGSRVGVDSGLCYDLTFLIGLREIVNFQFFQLFTFC